VGVAAQWQRATWPQGTQGSPALIGRRSSADIGHSPWEVAIAVAKGRLVLDRDVGEWVQTALSLPGLRLEPISAEVAVASTRLPGVIHSDAADRMIAATARHLGSILITADQLLLDYGKNGRLKALEAGQ